MLCALCVPQLAGAEGFAINEWSAEGVAMGGARMFAEGDAANVAYNPASITKVDGEAFKVSATYISPHGEYDLYKMMVLMKMTPTAYTLVLHRALTMLKS